MSISSRTPEGRPHPLFSVRTFGSHQPLQIPDPGRAVSHLRFLAVFRRARNQSDKNRRSLLPIGETGKWYTILWSPLPICVLVIHVAMVLLLATSILRGFWTIVVFAVVCSLYALLGGLTLAVGLFARRIHYSQSDHIRRIETTDNTSVSRAHVHRSLIAPGIIMMAPAVWLVVILAVT